jgi:cold shock CspA family protein
MSRAELMRDVDRRPPPGERRRGFVLKFDSEKKYGFLDVSFRRELLFFHVRDIRGGSFDADVRVGQRATFLIGHDRTGRLRALDVEFEE